MRNFKKNKKGVSDVIAVLLMIAIAVAASLIAYAWVMGYLGGTTNKVGKSIQIQSMANVTGNLVVYVQNVGDGPISLSSIYVNGILNQTAAIGQPLLQKTNTTSITTSFPPGFVSTDTVDVKVVCSDGTFIEASQTIPGA